MNITMPQLGESVTEGTIGKWLVAPGDQVTKYQAIAEVITDKVTAEIPAPSDGVIIALDVPEGETVKVGTLIASLRSAGEAAVDSGPAANSPAKSAAATSPTLAVTVRSTQPVGDGDGPRYSPVVMRLAQEHQLDLAGLTGTGLGGRITRKDVEAYVASGSVSPQARAIPIAPASRATPTTHVAAPAAPAAPAGIPALAPRTSGPMPKPMGDDQVIKVDPIRRRIAEKMSQSKHEAPHAWTMMTVDVTGLVKLRAAMNEEFKRRAGTSLSYVPFFIQAVVEALREFPIINSQWAGDEIILKREINISIAVATETALAVPVIRNADRLSITGLNHAVSDLATRARAGKLTVDDISGGTFTVNNTGYFGSFMSAPIINHPQAAILSFEAITKTPVVLDNDAIAIRSMMNMCMSLDHRVLDGLVCGRFLQSVKQRLETYAPGSTSLV